MPTARLVHRAVTLTALWLVAGCGGGGGFPDAAPSDVVQGPDTGTDAAADVRGRDTAVQSTNLVLLAVEPDHGPFNGGTSVTLRGSNLTADAVVTFGGAMVQPRDESLTDSHRLVVLTPSGAPGTVDVNVVEGSQHSNLAMAYTYDDFYADPNTGSIAGGTLITLHGQATGWTAATTVTIDAQPCTNVTLVSPAEITCQVPAHAQGAVPITVTTGSVSDTVDSAFTYFEAADPNNGGFGGGHIAGNINVAVLNQLTSNAVPGAYVFLGTDPTVGPPHAGVTDTHGQVTLSAADITGPVTITASAHCFASSTFIDIDGRDATIFLIPWLDTVPGVDCGMGMPPGGGGPGTFAAQIQGELVWSGPAEFAPNPWDNVPLPHANERRVAYVMTTQSTILGGNPDPGLGGTVVEVIPPDYGGRGYAYTIVARPAALAVYALAGLERTDMTPGQFTPYVMGVARSVLGSPRAMLTGVDINMNIPLDHEMQIQLHSLPPPVNGHPDTVQIQNWIDLGGEGVIPRTDVGVTGVDVGAPWRLVAQPAFSSTLSDATMIVRAVDGSSTALQDPESTVVISGINSPDDTVDVSHWVGVPRIVSPIDGGSIPATRVLQFDVSGSDPDMFWTMISQNGSSCRYGFYLGDVVWWQHFFPGNVRQVSVPDISSIPMLTDIPRGLYQLSLCGFNTAGFDYNNFSYQYLSQYYWTAYGTNSVTLAR